MKIEDQVVSFDLAQEMKGLGAEQDSAFAWYQYKNYKEFVALKRILCEEAIPEEYNDGYTEAPKEICDAYTEAELGEMLPENHMSYKFFNNVTPTIPRWCCRSPEDEMSFECANKEVDARAKMWIWLEKEKEKKQMLTKEEKKRILHSWNIGLSSGEISEDVINWRFPELFRNIRKEVEAYIKEKDQ